MTWSNLRFNVWRSFVTTATNLPSCFLIQFLEQLLTFLVNFTLLKYVKSQRSYGFLITKELIFGFQILDLKDHLSASLRNAMNYLRWGPQYIKWVSKVCSYPQQNPFLPRNHWFTAAYFFTISLFENARTKWPQEKRRRRKDSSQGEGKTQRDFMWNEEYPRERGVLNFWAYLCLQERICLKIKWSTNVYWCPLEKVPTKNF